MNIKLKSLLLKEQLSVTDVRPLEQAAKAFVQTLLKDKILTSYHQDMTSADVGASQYTEELANAIKDEVISWVNTINSRGGR
jgi:hypothetical protein